MENTTRIKKKYRLKKKYKNILWISFLLFFIFLLGYSVYQIVIWNMDNHKLEQVHEEILKVVTVDEIMPSTETSAPVNAPVETDIYWKYQDVSMIDVDINKLKEENKDTIGWIQVMGTNVNYPIVQSEDNSYYLNHDFKKRWNGGGWIFLDYRNDLNNLGFNNIIYGHRRYNKSMFGNLKIVLSNEWLNNTDNHIIKISTDKYNYLFQVFSVYSTPIESYYITTDFNSSEEYLEFLNTLVARSIYNFNTEVNEKTQILTLSTCHNDNDRLVVHSKLIKINEKN